MNSNLRHILFACIATTLLWGCRNDIAWSDSKTVPADGWNADQSIEFMIDPVAYLPQPENKYAEMTKKAMGDTVKRYLGNYTGRLALRYMPDCNTDTLRLVVAQESLTAYQRTDTISVLLFDTSGRPTGTGHLGIFEKELPLPTKVRILEGSFITVTPVPYSEKITGLKDITLILGE